MTATDERRHDHDRVGVALMSSASAVCFAFGQTGAGKTHTLLGDRSVRGLYELAAADLFAFADASSSLDVVASYYEIYCGQLYDLLAKRSRSSVSRLSLMCDPSLI